VKLTTQDIDAIENRAPRPSQATPTGCYFGTGCFLYSLSK